MSGFVVWCTGLSGAGKSTLSRLVFEELCRRGHPAELLDGDEVRAHLSKGLGFSSEDRDTNVLRIGWVASMLSRHGVGVVTAAISPYAETRARVRAMCPNFFEVFVDAPLEVVARRDVKGLYAKAMAGEVAHFTGVSDPYEPPANPEVHVRTDQEPSTASADRVIAALEQRRLLEPRSGPAVRP